MQPESGVLRYSCAGHNTPLLFRRPGDEVVELTTTGIALGVLEEATLGEAVTTLEHGDILVCYTDGVTEAIDEAEEPLGVSRLIDVVTAHREESAAGVLAAIVERLIGFTGDRAPFDDVTMLVIKRTN